MAEDKRKSFPKITVANWFNLRDKFIQKVPTEVSSSYVASALGMSEASAKANVIGPLKAIGIIDENSKPTDLAYDWRDDVKYKEVCEKILSNNYPQELHDLYQDPDTPISDIASWFMRYGKVGSVAAKMFAQTYLLFLNADPTKAKEIKSSTSTRKLRPKKQQISAKKKTEKSKQATQVEKPDLQTYQQNNLKQKGIPSLHIDIQIHISPDTSSDQIDKIFESMAKHLKDFYKG